MTTYRVRYGAGFVRPAETMQAAVAVANALISLDLYRQQRPQPAFVDQRMGDTWVEIAMMFGGEE